MSRMHSKATHSIGLCAVLLLGAPGASRAEIHWFVDSEPKVLTVTDLTQAGQGWVPPTAENPIYYRAISYGCDYGAMPGDKVPETRRMTKFIVDLLAEQNFRGADDQHPATLYLSFQWGFYRGSLDQKLAYLGGRKFDLMWETRGDNSTIFPWMRRAMRPPEVQMVMDVAQSGDLYALTINAFNFNSVEVEDKPVMLWQTRIACPATGAYMTTALPRLATTGAALIGRETTKPVWQRPDDGPAGKVEYGELEVLGVDEDLKK